MSERTPDSDDRIIYAHLSKPIVLVGMMGAGKSYVGAALGRVLGREFYDSDKVIEQKAGMGVAEIFESFGEAKFRESEKNTILELLDEGACVIASGGGALMHEETLAALKARSVMVWLDADLEVLWARVQKSQNRPLLFDDDPKGTLAELMAARRGLYEQAHVRVVVDEGNAGRSLEMVLEALRDFG